jgi:Homing endonuclease associated repeat
MVWGSAAITQEMMSSHLAVFRVVPVTEGLTRKLLYSGPPAFAGLRQSPMADRRTDQDYLDNLRVVAAHVGREPIPEDMNRPPSRITSGSYRYRFGSWEAAVAAALA